ncbi:hypothetical protein [Candidatus Laterigemmans baculatus]|uniref:hypothetical protein n=1 Tax=Candidatus Laterigemmans baculatus TaxID=2770505 RepID=UPI0013DD1306|nr:hypothetical protein [Candidatus Laterigemmans baculatus]
MTAALSSAEPFLRALPRRLFGFAPCIGLAACLVLSSPRVADAQFDDNDPIFSVKPPAAAPEEDPGPAVDIRGDVRPLLAVELGLIRRVCQPTPAQKKQIAAAADECLDALNMIAVLNQGEQGGGSEIVAVTRNGVQLTELPLTRIEREMAKALRPILSPEQHAAYVDETIKRAESRRQSVVSVAVLLIDQQLILTDEQRERITARLLDEWQEAAAVPIEMYISNPQHFPDLPGSVMRSELDPEQMVVWVSLKKTRFPFYVGRAAMNPWEEELLP